MRPWSQRPAKESSAWPSIADSSTPTTATASRASSGRSQRDSSPGSSSTASRAPPTNPAIDSPPRRSPWRHPAQPNRAATTSSPTSSAFTAGPRHRPGRWTTRFGSQGRSQPASRSIVSRSPAVNPHTSSPATWNAGPTYPLGMPHPDPVGRVRERGERDPGHRGDLARVGGPDRRRLAPPAENRGDDEVRRRQPERGQGPEDVDAGRVETGLLRGLPQRRAGRPVVVGVDGATGEGRLPGVRTHVVGPLDQQDVRPGARRLAEQHEHGALSAVELVRRQEPRHLTGLDSGHGVDDGRQPRRKRGGNLAVHPALVAHRSILTPSRRDARRSSARSRAASSMAPSTRAAMLPSGRTK